MDLKLKEKGEAKVSKRRVGLDIGGSAVKMVEISGPADRPSLEAIGFKDISGHAGFLPALIRKLADEIKVSSKEAVISVSGKDAIVRFVSMPKMREEELKNAVRFETERVIPFDIKECMIDFQILNKDAKEAKWQILIVAAKKEHVVSRIKMAEEAGFAVSVVDVDSLALANVFLRNYPAVSPDKAFALLDIGAAFANLSIMRSGAPCFVRGISMEKAPDAAEGPKDAMAGLFEELRLSLSYHENQSGSGVDEIYLSGGNARMEGLDGLIEEAFGIKPKIWDSLGFLDKSSPSLDAKMAGQEAARFAVAAGLALRK